MKKIIKINSTLLLIVIFVCVSQTIANGQNTTTLLEGAKAAIEKRDYEAAIRDLNIIISREPDSEEALTQRARAFINHSKFAEASQDVDRVLKMNPKSVIALNIRGVVKSNKKDYTGAIADYTQAVTLDPKYSKAYRNRGFARIENKESLNSVLADYNAFLQYEPQNLNALQEAGNYCLNKNGAYGVCAAYFEKYKTFKPDSMIGYLGYALSYANVHQTVADKNFLKGEIVNNFRRAIELDPKDATAPLNLGRLLLNLEDYDNSIVALTQAVTLNPKDAWAYAMRGDNYKYKKDYDRAIADYTKALEIDPAYRIIYSVRAKVMFEKGVQQKYGYATETEKKYWDTVKNDYQKAAELSNQNYEAYEELNKFLFSLSRILPGYKSGYEAEKFLQGSVYKPLIAADPKNVCARNFLLQSGSYFKSKDQWDELINSFDGVNGAQCASDAALWIGRNYAVGDSYAGVARNYDKAREYYNLALKFYPNAKYVRSWMAELPSSTPTYNSGSSNSSNNTISRQDAEQAIFQKELIEYEYNVKKFLKERAVIALDNTTARAANKKNLLDVLQRGEQMYRRFLNSSLAPNVRPVVETALNDALKLKAMIEAEN